MKSERKGRKTGNNSINATSHRNGEKGGISRVSGKLEKDPMDFRHVLDLRRQENRSRDKHI